MESLELARDSAAANQRRELAAVQRDAAQATAQHVHAQSQLHSDLDWHKSEVRRPPQRPRAHPLNPSALQRTERAWARAVRICAIWISAPQGCWRP